MTESQPNSCRTNDSTVFIWYAKEDLGIAKKLYGDLKKRGVKTWMESEDLLAGQNRDMIRHVIKKSLYILTILSSHALSDRGEACKHLRVALSALDEVPDNQILIIPVRIDECEAWDERLQRLHPVDLFLSYENGFSQILRVIESSHQKRFLREVTSESSIHELVEPKSDKPKLIRCPLCGKYNDPTQTFRCPLCEQDNLCIRHQDDRKFICGICVEKQSDKKHEVKPEGRKSKTSEIVVRSEHPVGDIWREPYTGMEFIFIKGGGFQMGDIFGDGFDDAKPVHEVFVNDFYLGKYPVTFDVYDRYCVEAGRELLGESGWGRGNRPVINVTWQEASDFASWLSRKHGFIFRLPYEAEWEFAARSRGKNIMYSGCDISREPDDCTWYDGNSGRRTQPVGIKKTNAEGLHDMTGNVSEWCEDWYGVDYYSKSPAENPQGPGYKGLRVIRGGSWMSTHTTCRTTSRHSRSPTIRSNFVGFRLIMALS